jgi:hypothetical protein
VHGYEAGRADYHLRVAQVHYYDSFKRHRKWVYIQTLQSLTSYFRSILYHRFRTVAMSENMLNKEPYTHFR